VRGSYPSGGRLSKAAVVSYFTIVQQVTSFLEPSSDALVSRRRTILRVLLGAAVFLVVATAIAWLVSGDVRYLLRAGVEEARILYRRRPIANLIADSSIAPRRLEQLRLVLEARDYAAELGLDAKETYTSYSDVGRDTLLLVLSASERHCICPVTWRYPIVGSIPYKGFFDAGMAVEAAESMKERGLDVHLRPAGAFSTLGWFNDPLLSTALSRDDVELTATVLHEIAHNTLWVPGGVSFNESFAQYVGYHAAARFYLDRGDTALAKRAADRWWDEMVLADYYEALVGRLNRFYDTAPDSAALEAGRAAIADWAEVQLDGPVAALVRTIEPAWVQARPINNARLVGVRLYRTDLDLFEAWHRRHGGDVARSVAALAELVEGAEGDEAFDRLREALGR
jgi:predicted aminopeptidase